MGAGDPNGGGNASGSPDADIVTRNDSAHRGNVQEDQKKLFPESEPIKNQGDKLEASPQAAKDDFFQVEENQDEPDH